MVSTKSAAVGDKDILADGEVVVVVVVPGKVHGVEMLLFVLEAVVVVVSTTAVGLLFVVITKVILVVGDIT